MKRSTRFASPRHRFGGALTAALFAASPLWAQQAEDYLDEQVQSQAMLNYLTAAAPAGELARPASALSAEAAQEKPVTIQFKDGALSLFAKAGCYRFSQGGRSTDFLRLWVNDAEPLRGAKVIQEDARQLVVENSVDGLAVRVRFSLADDGALKVQPTIHNPGAQTVPLRQLVAARGSYGSLFDADELKSLRYFREHYNIWSSNHPGHFELKNQTIHGFYLGILFAPGEDRSLAFAYEPTILWTSCVQAEGKAQTLMAYTEFGKNPLGMSPGRKETFDTLTISLGQGLLDALLGYGRQFTPLRPVDHNAMAKNNGWNSWEYFKPSISEKNLKPVIAAMAENQQLTGLFPAFVVDAGYYEFYGKWVAHPAKFPKGMGEFAAQIKAAGLRPGIWSSPAWVSPEVVTETGFPTFPHPNGNETTTRIFDPSDPAANAYFLNQVSNFVAAGYTYFKTDFLHTAYRIDRDYAHSDYAPERVLREYYQKMRQAIGPDAYWLACGSVPIPVVGLCDASRTGPDVAANWERLLDSIQSKLIPRFWMHGNLWWADCDFLVVAGDYTRPGKPIHGVKSKGTSKDGGFTKVEAQTWANYLIITGGMITWSDDPSTISDEGVEIVKKTFQHGSGNMGVPLDYEKTTLPAKWVRREKDRIYVALFNWGEKPVNITVTSQEIPELNNAQTGIDVLLDRSFAVKSGRLETTLEPHASVCIEIKTSK